MLKRSASIHHLPTTTNPVSLLTGHSTLHHLPVILTMEFQFPFPFS